MQDPSHSSPHHLSALEEAFKGIAQSVATSIVDALVEPLRLEIECKVNALIAEATQDVHAKIAAALGQIQPFNIPINLFAQPVVQPLQSAPPVSAATTPPIPPAVQATAPEAQAEPVLEPEPVKTPAAKVTAPTPPQALERVEQEEEGEDLLGIIRSEKARTPKRSSKNFAATIVGLMPGQAHMIKKEFKFAKFSFVSADARNSSQLISLAKNNNTVIFMTDFIRHAAVETVRAAHGHWIYVSGGMSTLREKIQELYEQHNTEQATVFG